MRESEKEKTRSEDDGGWEWEWDAVEADNARSIVCTHYSDCV